MGYSVATPIAGKRLHERMLVFLRAHWRPFKDLTGYGGFLSEPTDDLSYDHGPLRIGFDYNASSVEREYAYHACRWMALRVGRLARIASLPDLGPVPYILYDGGEKMPVLGRDARPVPHAMRWCVYGSTGERLARAGDLLRREFILLDGVGPYRAIRREMRRLDALWAQEGRR